MRGAIPDTSISGRRVARELPDDARKKIAAWGADFDTARPHSALAHLTPAACAASFTATDDRLRNPDQFR